MSILKSNQKIPWKKLFSIWPFMNVHCLFYAMKIIGKNSLKNTKFIGFDLSNIYFYLILIKSLY